MKTEFNNLFTIIDDPQDPKFISDKERAATAKAYKEKFAERIASSDGRKIILLSRLHKDD